MLSIIYFENGKIKIEKNDVINFPTFKDLKLKEEHIEEFLRLNIDLIFEEENVLIIGQQVRNKENGRSDLIAIDGEGNLVLIEIKRDKEDITNRKEPFEFQAIRYAANLATVKTIDDLVSKIFVPYIEKHKNEFHNDNLTTSEIAYRTINEFLDGNDAYLNFNKKQRIILVASEFDNQTLSACSWLVANGVDIKCYVVQPIQLNDTFLFDISLIMPQRSLDEFYLELLDKNSSKNKTSKNTKKRAENLKMATLIEAGIVKIGETLSIKGVNDSEATVLDDKFVEHKDTKMTFNDWGKLMKGWGSINVYRHTWSPRLNGTLNDLYTKAIDNKEK